MHFPCVTLLVFLLLCQAWLAAGTLPGGLDGLDRQSYEQAVATYAVLQEAASKGLEYLEQVRPAAAALAPHSCVWGHSRAWSRLDYGLLCFVL